MRALAAAMVRSKNKIDPEFIRLDSSIEPETLIKKIQSIINDASNSKYNAILILLPCEKWFKTLEGLTITKLPVVIPRKLICTQPICSQLNVSNDDIKNNSQDDWVFAWEVNHLQPSKCDTESVKSNYTKPIFKYNEPVNLFDTSSLLLWEREAEIESEWFGWDFEKLTTDFNILQRLVNGYWSYEDFIVLMPGSQFNPDIHFHSRQYNKISD
ncbi:MAG: hypothetical protein ACPMAG_00505 [Limisphaerales bacterium]